MGNEVSTEFRGFDDKILSIYALGLTTRQIQDRLKEMYAVEVSQELISRVTDGVKELAAEWRGRALEPFYPVLFLDALRVNIRDGAMVVKKSVYLALAIRLDGQKELLGLWIEQNEGARFWMGIMNELKSRGVQDILLAAVDGLTGFPDAIAAVFPKTEVQLCADLSPCPHGPQFGAVRPVQRPHGGNRRPENHLPCPFGGTGCRGPGRVRRGVG
jgi:transposase-like protein